MEKVREQTRTLTLDYIQHRMGIQAPPPNGICATIRILATEVEARNEGSFNHLAQTIQCADDPASDLADALGRVTELALNDGDISWGLMITMVAFAAVAARERLSIGGTLADGAVIAEAVAGALETHAGGWLLERGGWEAMWPELLLQHTPGDPAYGSSMAVIVILGIVWRLFQRLLRNSDTPHGEPQ